MIQICTMTTSFHNRREGGFISYPESIRRCKAAGFDVVDMNMCSMINPLKNELCGDDWERHVDEVIQTRDECGITFYQTHPVFRPGAIVAYSNPEDEAFYWKMMHRCLEITARIGAKWAVLHPSNVPETLDWAPQLEKNHRDFDECVDLAAKLGIGVAFENMVEPPKGGEKPHRFSSYPEELLALHDSYNCDYVKLCWDFGHGNTAVPERHPEAIRMLGDKLVCVHVDDNFGKKDDHYLPFRGNIRWEEVMPVLKEINFPGVLDLELNFAGQMPDPLQDDAIRLTAAVARQLAEMAER